MPKGKGCFRRDSELATTLDPTTLIEPWAARLTCQLYRTKTSTMRAMPPAGPNDIFEKDASVMLTWHLAPGVR
jgi:hypothetical protein